MPECGRTIMFIDGVEVRNWVKFEGDLPDQFKSQIDRYLNPSKIAVTFSDGTVKEYNESRVKIIG